MCDGIKKKLKKLLAENYEAVVDKLLTKANKDCFRKSVVHDIVLDAIAHILKQIDRGNLDWVLQQKEPSNVLTGLILTTSYKDARMKNVDKSIQMKNIEYTEVKQYHKHYGLSSETLISLREAIENALNPREQKVLQMYYFEEMRVREIALALKDSESAVKMRLLRARKKLKEYLS